MKTISGDWANFDGEEYFVYKTGNMLGLCIIGSHEPCFSVSSFFSKDDDNYKSQYEKFSSLLFNLKAQVEEAEKGGEKEMEELENKELENPTPAEDPEEKPLVEEFEKQEEVKEPEVEETVKEPTEYEVLQQKFEDLQNSYNELETKFSAAETRISELEQEKLNAENEASNFRNQNVELQNTISNYKKMEENLEEEKKNSLIDKYEQEKVLAEEEITSIREAAKDFSYDELEGKLAIAFANKKMAGTKEVKKVPLPEPEESQFALLIGKYRKR